MKRPRINTEPPSSSEMKRSRKQLRRPMMQPKTGLELSHDDNFKPNTELYGRKVILLDEDGAAYGEGTLTRIVGPHLYELDMDGKLRQWEVDSTNDFFEEDGELFLWCAWE
jgi:hypothetical protein